MTHPLRGLRLPLAAVAVFLTASIPGRAIDIYWDNPGSASWFDDVNWLPMNIPLEDDDVFIDNSGTALVGPGDPAVANNFFIGDTATGAVTINGGLLSNNIVKLGNQVGSMGSALLSAGTWNASSLDVGQEGTGDLTIDGGLLVSNFARIGASAGSQGDVTINGGMWQHNGDLAIGYDAAGKVTLNNGVVNTERILISSLPISAGELVINGGTWNNSTFVNIGNNDLGILTITGGLLHSDGLIVVGGNAFGEATVNFDGGIVEAPQIRESMEALHQVNLNGSIIRAIEDQMDFFSNFEAGDIIVQAGGAIFDTNGFSIGINAILGGPGDLTKQGEGSLLLSAANTYAGKTTILAGTLAVSDPMAIGGGMVDLQGGKLFVTGGPLTTSSVSWTGGKVALNVNSAAVLDVSTGNFGNGGQPGMRTFSLVNLTQGMTYTLVNFATTDFVESDFLAEGSSPNVQLDGVFNQQPTFLEYTIIGATATGAILQNSAPVLIPTFADFLVSGPVTTGTPSESNIINLLTFLGGSSLQVYNNLTVTSGIFNVPNGSASLFGDNVLTPGDFNKNGSGKLITAANIFVGGAANINEGALIVNGQLTANGGVTVFQNALLGGGGMINGDVFNNGFVSPGNSPGTLTINGNYTQSGSGTLLIEFGDLLRVSGWASLAGTLQYLGGSNLEYGQQITFLQAGSISGDFDRILMPDSDRFRGRFLAEGGTGILLVAPTSYTLVAETTNQRNVAKALDSYIPERNNDRETVSIALDLQSEEQYPFAFDQIAPTFYESLGNITIEQAFVQTQQLNQRLSAVRLGTRGFQAIGIESPLVHDKDGKSVLEAKDAKAVVETATSTNWNIWVMGNGQFGRVTNVSQVPNYDFNSGGFLVGADYTWSENFATGLYTGYQYTWADYGSAGNTQINSALFGGYATYDNGGFYADAVVGGGYNGYRVRRSIEFSTVDRTARSTPNGGQLNVALNLGYDWEIGKFTLGPIAGLQYTYAGIAPFTEDGADSLDLRVNQQNVNSIRSTLGARIAYAWNLTENVAIIPEIRMLWMHEFLNNPRNISSALDAGAGPTFGFETSAPARDSVFAGAGISAQFGERWNAFVFYNIDFGRQDYLGNYVSGGLGWKF